MDLAQPQDQDPSIDAAVQWLNRAVQASGVRLAMEVSEYVLTTFFGGDFNAFADHDRTKPQSFAALVRRQDLAISETTLYRLVRIGQQARHLPSAVAEALSPTHHRVLLGVRDLRHKGRLAREAAEQNWTVARLAQEVKALEPGNTSKTGRPPLPPLVKALGEVTRSWHRGVDVAAFGQAYSQLSAQHKAELRAEVAKLEADLAEIRRALQEFAESGDVEPPLLG
ncbi:MAG: hypothetical protein HY902_12785 [Deltaproteobacteria bacterium]|nr:hypothetical protein [Deltaproteobacteria bacterium]